MHGIALAQNFDFALDFDGNFTIGNIEHLFAPVADRFAAKTRWFMHNDGMELRTFKRCRQPLIRDIRACNRIRSTAGFMCRSIYLTGLLQKGAERCLQHF